MVPKYTVTNAISSFPLQAQEKRKLVKRPLFRESTKEHVTEARHRRDSPTKRESLRLEQMFPFRHVLPDIGIMVRVFANGPGDLGSIPGRVIPKTLKMVLDASLLNTQHYKVRIKGKVEEFWERSSALPNTLV